MNAATNVSRANTLAGMLVNRAANQPEHPAYHFIDDTPESDVKLSYRNLLREAASLAVSLQIMELQGKPVLLACKSNFFFIISLYACFLSGAVAVPTAPPRRQALEERISFLCGHSGASAVLTDSEAMLGLEMDITMIDVRQGRPSAHAPITLDWAPDEKAADQPALIQYTSGTMGEPHGVVHSQASLIAASVQVGTSFRHAGDSAMLVTLPLFHDLGLMYGVIHPLVADVPVYLMTPAQFVQHPLRWLQRIALHRISTVGGANFMFDIVTRAVEAAQLETLDLSCLRACFCTGEPVRAGTMARLLHLLAPCGLQPQAILPCYSLSEAGRHITGAIGPRPFTLDLPGIFGAVHPVVSCGAPHHDCRLLIVEPDSLTVLADGQIGEIWLQCASTGLRYWNEPLVTEQIFHARLNTGEGPFLRSGDAGYMSKGELYVLGRLADRIRISGADHAPHDLELQAERSHEGLRPSCAAAFLVDGRDRTRLVVACELKKEMLRTREKWPHIQAAIRSAIRRVHCIAVDEVVLLVPGALPKTSSGKVRRNQCRTDYLNNRLLIA